MPSAQTYPTWSVEALPRRDKKWLSLLTLRFGTMLCSLVGIGCFSWAFTQHDGDVVYTDGIGAGYSSFNIGTSTYGFIWSYIFLIYVLCGYTVHPGVSIAFDCIAFLAQIITTLMYLAELGHYHPDGYEERGDLDDKVWRAEVAGCSLLMLGVVFYFTLIVRASIACHAQRKEARQVQTKSVGFLMS